MQKFQLPNTLHYYVTSKTSYIQTQQNIDFHSLQNYD